MIHLLYGQPGTGKSTLATSIAREYAGEGKKVATNYHVDWSPVSNRPDGPMAKAWVTVIPDRPSIGDLMCIGMGWHDGEFGREDRAGLLVVDEAGPWLNSRTWSDKNRAEIIDWFLHSRKRGWDIVLIAQAPSLLDKQIRDAVIEGYARCRRMDRVKIPVLGIAMPRIHVAVARYGLDQNAPVLQRWWYRGGDIHKCYQSYQIFAQDDAVDAPFSTLPPRLTKWRNAVTPWVEFRRKVNLAGLVALAGFAYALAFVIPGMRRILVDSFKPVKCPPARLPSVCHTFNYAYGNRTNPMGAVT